MDDTSRTTTLQVKGSEAGDRIDRWLTAACPDLSRSAVKRLIDSADVLVEGKVVKSSHRVSEGESVTVTIPPLQPLTLEAEDLPLDIVFEDDHLIVVNKAAGMVVHPAQSLRSGTLVNALLHHCAGSLSGVGGVVRPGIVHRLDMDTSGCIVAAKNDAAHLGLAEQFKVEMPIASEVTQLVTGQRDIQQSFKALLRAGIGREDEPF